MLDTKSDQNESIIKINDSGLMKVEIVRRQTISGFMSKFSCLFGSFMPSVMKLRFPVSCENLIILHISHGSWSSKSNLFQSGETSVSVEIIF